MIDVIRFDHISMAVAEMDPQIELLERLFGFRATERFEEDGFYGANLEVPGSSDLGWEVLTPKGEGSYLHRFLEGPHGPGLHHVAIQVGDISQAVEAMRVLGVEPWGVHEPGTDGAAADAGDRGEPELAEDDETRGIAYIHPKQGGNGFLYQLYSGSPWHTAEPFEDDGAHTLGIIAVNHLSHAHPSRRDLGNWYRHLFGMERVYRSADGEDGAGFRTEVLETPTEQLRFEILEPAGEDSFVQRFLERRGPSMHHVTFEVGDWERAVEACRHHGVATFGERSGETDGVPWREAFIHPRDTGGMLVQFFWQAAPGVWI